MLATGRRETKGKDALFLHCSVVVVVSQQCLGKFCKAKLDTNGDTGLLELV
jgi:hypothetical protein